MIYLVDDDPIQNLITSQLMRPDLLNIEYSVFNNGQDLLDNLSTGVLPRLIILDINMPIMDGWEFLEEYKSFEEKSPIVMLTSSINDRDFKKSKDYPFVVGYYSKPVDLASIREILNKHT